MPGAIFRFYEELNDFLPRHRRKTDFEADFKGRRSIKDMIESLGVPHTEVDLILINGKSVDFTYILMDRDRVSVYPVFETFNIEHVTRLRGTPLRGTRFIADTNLGNIAKYMRVLGLDVSYDPSLSAHRIIEISKKEQRIILTRSTKLLKFKDVTHGVFLRPGTMEEQIRGVIETLDIKDSLKPFSRCLLCNSLLESIPKEKVFDKIPPKVRGLYNEYTRCNLCGKIYWKGTHYHRMKKWMNSILNL